MSVIKLGLVTSNDNKLAELADLLPTGYAVVRLDRGEVEETGSTFEENAALKAIAGLSDCAFALGEDSGLEVEALGMAPGVYSKRYGDSDAERIERLLHELQGIEDREARFVTVIAMARRGAATELFRGEVQGTIAHTPSGGHGFGYDPIFLPDEGDGRSFAEMTREEKGRISHRGRALAALVQRLAGLSDLGSDHSGT
ncbi:RdgB/HAM1 family non-canonical purine NTP pyrophosphatase [Ferrimicrobium sp.]|uniref:RdgB/HAM1 family non-canonical purine NTP pyrophosphatase n=1 Tax=Ferrimicrobium sp. TaxID=2926050 RepID=UPI002613F956|nr:RdgB/HAM1 family non-canonical purine NTP pyrophosphatase [Ferrimicrobium sp.]